MDNALKGKPSPNGTKALRDLALVFVACVLVYVLIRAFDLFDVVAELSREYGRRETDELLGVLVVLVFALALFSMRRCAELRNEFTERKRMEREILETKEYYEKLVGSAGDAIISVDRDQRVVTWNFGAERLYGYDQREAVGKKVYDLLGGPNNGKEVYDLVNGAMTSEDIRAHEAETYRKDGQRIDVAITLTPLRDSEGSIAGLCAIHKNITERKKLEQEVIETKEFLERLIATAGDAIVCADRDGVLTVWNPAAERLYGYTSAEALGKPFFSLIVPQEKRREAECLYELLNQGEVTQGFETQRRRKDGSLVWVSISNAPLFDKDGTRIGNIGIHKDVTERRRAEADVRRMSEYFQNLIGTAGDAIVAADRGGRVTLWNIGAERIFGYERDEAIGRSVPALIGGPDKFGEMLELQQRVINGGLFRPFETRCYRKDGTPVWVSITLSPMRDADGKVTEISAIFKDVTEERRIREQLMQMDKMSSLGKLISGVAHELNNPLTAVMGFSKLLLGNISLEQQTRADVEKIHSQAERAAGIVSNLLTFARQHKPGKLPVAVNDLLSDVLKLRAYEFRVSNIEVVEDLDAFLPETIADPFQLKQVFLNLITNAEQAMLEANGRGKIAVRTSKWRDAAQKAWVRVEIADDGPGIEPSDLPHVFDPFFTTKEVGKGAGLGLSICYGIVQEHGGRIFVESEPERGARFFIDLPINREEEMEKTSEAIEQAAPPGKSVLVVDDEEFILELFARVLREGDYWVETATNGRAALDKLRHRDFHLVILDYKMPVMGGQKLYRWIEREKPHLARRVLLVTGDTLSAEIRAFLKETGLPYLEKPFRVEEAKELIGKLLEHEPAQDAG